YDLKWRGVALNLFHGRSWSSSLEQRPALHLPDGEILPLPVGPRRGDSGDEPTVSAGSRNIHYRVMMEPIGANVFFVTPKVGSLRGFYGRVNVDSAGALYDVDSDRPIGAYEANSNIAQVPPQQLRQASENYPAVILLADLQLPNIDPRIPRLAQQVTASADNNYDRAVALEHYLISTYGYTLELPRTSPPDPLANFLFERKRGHCEYFASAMAVMLRTLHIPSRVVNGFRTGEFNDLTSSYVVRASNAHSWVEAYFPGYGWVSFDPTPAAPVQFRGGWNRMMLYMDAMASFWREWVIDYDSSHQAILGHQAARGSRIMLDSMRSWAQSRYAFLLAHVRELQNRMARSPRRWIFIALALTLILLLLANARQIWNFVRDRRLGAHPERAPSLAATIWYERLTRALARAGWRKSSQQTPIEFIHTIHDADLRHLVTQFTSHYELARFGGSAKDACLLPGLYGMITAGKEKRKTAASNH
ncbi:MAG TPA: transglutaminase domain-containing protein, partial [Terriglobales bacterium]|nr:transglutaminase domain-containing protein [Terriglobales bacterium]